jgi:hypothetical protein
MVWFTVITKKIDKVVVFIRLSSRWQISERKQREGGEISFSSWSQKLWFVVVRLHCSGPVMRQSITGEGHGKAELLISWKPGSRNKREGPVKGTRPCDPRPPARPHLPWSWHLPMGYSHFKSTNGSNHWLGESPPDLIISGNTQRCALGIS